MPSLGVLPISWANMSANVPTFLNVSSNKLHGPVPSEWYWHAPSSNLTAGTGGSSWDAIDVSFNKYVCGTVPNWFTNRTMTYGLSTAAVLAGECIPACNLSNSTV